MADVGGGGLGLPEHELQALVEEYEAATQDDMPPSYQEACKRFLNWYLQEYP